MSYYNANTEQNPERTENRNARMKGLPRSQHELLEEAMSLGLLDPNPSFEEPRAKLLSFINDSKGIRRAINHVSIMLVGNTGSGKSSTINHLFNTSEGSQLAPTNSTQSETRITSEFILSTDDPDYEVTDLQIGIVDTPGFNDTNGYKQDACNFYSIKKFYKTHPKLAGCYPNLIFLLVEATDNRIKGPNSNLSKSLRCLKQLGLVDHHYPNVVAILSFCCSVSYKNVTIWNEKMEEKKTIVRDIIFQALNVTAPVIALENDYGEYGHDLEIVGDFTRLPNGLLQPKNLYDACQILLRRSGDNLGLITLNACFAKPEKKVQISGHNVQAKDSGKDHLNKEEEKLVKFFEELSKGGK